MLGQETSVQKRATHTMKVYMGSELHDTIILFTLALSTPRPEQHSGKGCGKVHKNLNGV